MFSGSFEMYNLSIGTRYGRLYVNMLLGLIDTTLSILNTGIAVCADLSFVAMVYSKCGIIPWLDANQHSSAPFQQVQVLWNTTAKSER